MLFFPTLHSAGPKGRPTCWSPANLWPLKYVHRRLIVLDHRGKDSDIHAR